MPPLLSKIVAEECTISGISEVKQSVNYLSIVFIKYESEGANHKGNY